MLNGAMLGRVYDGFYGKGYVQFRWPIGDSIEWVLHNCHRGSHRISFRYALDTANRPLRLLLNEKLVTASFWFPSTGSWQTWRWVSFVDTLHSGKNVLKVRLAV